MVYIYSSHFIETLNYLSWQVLFIFFYWGLSSCFILLGTSLLYTNSGVTNLDGNYVITGLYSIANEYFSESADAS